MTIITVTCKPKVWHSSQKPQTIYTQIEATHSPALCTKKCLVIGVPTFTVYQLYYLRLPNMTGYIDINTLRLIAPAQKDNLYKTLPSMELALSDASLLLLLVCYFPHCQFTYQL